jgi:hypothetical protein
MSWCRAPLASHDQRSGLSIDSQYIIYIYIKYLHFRCLTYSKVKVMLRQTVGQSECRGVKFTLESVTRYYILPERCCVVSVGRPLWREVGSAVSHFQQCLVHCQRLNIIYTVHVTCFMYMQYILDLSTGSVQQIMPTFTLQQQSRRLAAAKFEPLMFSVSGFALPNMADICIFMIFYQAT